MTLEEIKVQMAELEAKKKVLEQAQKEEWVKRRAATKKTWRFIVLLKPEGYHDKVWDPSIRWVRLLGEVSNQAECLAAGHDESSVKGWKGMSYLYNTATHKLVMASGGGHIFIRDEGWAFGLTKEQQVQAAEDAARVRKELGFAVDAGLYEGKDEIDVTHIILSQQHFGWE